MKSSKVDVLSTAEVPFSTYATASLAKSWAEFQGFVDRIARASMSHALLSGTLTLQDLLRQTKGATRDLRCLAAWPISSQKKTPADTKPQLPRPIRIPTFPSTVS